MPRPKLPPEVKAERQREYRQREDVKARKREHMRKYNQRPEVIARRRDYYDNVALPRMCGLNPAVKSNG